MKVTLVNQCSITVEYLINIMELTMQYKGNIITLTGLHNYNVYLYPIVAMITGCWGNQSQCETWNCLDSSNYEIISNPILNCSCPSSGHYNSSTNQHWIRQWKYTQHKVNLTQLRNNSRKKSDKTSG